MEPVVVTLASNERYFPGLYCALASVLRYRDPMRRLDLKVLDGGLSRASLKTLAALVEPYAETVRLEFVTADWSAFRNATLGPGQSQMAYCRILLPHLLNVQRVIYVDCDVLVFRDLSELFDNELSSDKIIGAVRDSETLTLADDSASVAKAMSLPRDGVYFNSGVMLLDLAQLRRNNFTEQSIDFLAKQTGQYRFHDQSAINFLLHGRIAELPEYWNRASWRFDQQEDNTLNCVLHYTRSAPWAGGSGGPAQLLFERFAANAGLPVNRQSAAFTKSRRRRFLRNVVAPFRALGFPLVSFFYRIAGEKEKSASYGKAACYWRHYILNASHWRRLHRKRAEEIRSMTFKFGALSPQYERVASEHSSFRRQL